MINAATSNARSTNTFKSVSSRVLFSWLIPLEFVAYNQPIGIGYLVVYKSYEHQVLVFPGYDCFRQPAAVVMSYSACPFCQQLFPLSELERHANHHLAEEELERDLELAHQIACKPTSPNRISDNLANFSELLFPETPESSVTRNRSDTREDHIHEKISCLSRLQIECSFHRVEDGPMNLLRRCLELEKGNSVCILTDQIDHFQSLESEDAGWGCGWRNIQMLSSHFLMQRPEAREVLFGGSGFVPDISSLQRWLEIAWEMDFDVPGSYHFNRKVYGLTKKIGTTECAALFRSFGLRARVVDFDKKGIESVSSVNGTDGSGKRKSKQVSGPMDKYLYSRNSPLVDPPGLGKSAQINTHVNVSESSTEKNDNKSTNTSKAFGSHQILMEWVWNYFADEKLDTKGSLQRITVSNKTPLYFQHDGHSRTIVGIQVKQQSRIPNQYTLLILDPGHRTEALERSLRQNFGWQKLIKRGVHTLRKPQYQLCYIDPGIAGGKELEQLKTIDSTLLEL